MPEAWNEATAQEIIDAHTGLEGPLLPIAHALMAAFGCIPREAVPLIAHTLNLSRAEVHGTLSFYHDFRTQPAGRRTLRLCRAEACQSLGGRALAEELFARLGIEWGGTTRDGELTVEPVYCLGLCAVAPAALIDGEPVGRLDASRLVAALEDAS
jgi:formate dehydrogenase subunit gamma